MVKTPLTIQGVMAIKGVAIKGLMPCINYFLMHSVPIQGEIRLFMDFSSGGKTQFIGQLRILTQLKRASREIE